MKKSVEFPLNLRYNFNFLYCVGRNYKQYMVPKETEHKVQVDCFPLYKMVNIGTSRTALPNPPN